METTLRDRVRALRKTAGLTVEQLAERAKLSDSLVSKLESGARGDGLTAEAALSLAAALGCSVEFLVRGDVDTLSPTSPEPSPADATFTRPSQVA